MSNNQLAPTGGAVATRPKSFAPSTFGELLEFAKMVANSSLVPQDYRGRPGDIVVAVQTGAELGLSPMQSLQSVSVINGRPSVWGDGALALVRSSGLLEDFEEGVDGLGEARYGFCRAKRRGQQTPIEKRFTVADAKRAGLWTKKGPWTQYPERMLVMRARGFVLRDGFADALRGLITREEAADIPPPDEQQTKGAESDLPWTTRLSERGKPKVVEVAPPVAEEAAPPEPTEWSAPEVEKRAMPPEPTTELDPMFPTDPPWEGAPVLINEQDRRRFHACRSDGGHSEEDAKSWLFQIYGITSTKMIQKEWLGDICRRLQDPAGLVP